MATKRVAEMKRDYLGDSYDAVKRLWRDLLQDWAPLFAERRFIPQDLRKDFTLLTGIPILEGEPPQPYSILNDPDTGIRLPDETNQAERRTHIAIPSIVNQLHDSGPRCVITFDQSVYRRNKLNRESQRQEKMQALKSRGFESFYYVSHAPFLFSVRDRRTFQDLWQILTGAGIPASRLEKMHQQAV